MLKFEVLSIKYLSTLKILSNSFFNLVRFLDTLSAFFDLLTFAVKPIDCFFLDLTIFSMSVKPSVLDVHLFHFPLQQTLINSAKDR